MREQTEHEGQHFFLHSSIFSVGPEALDNLWIVNRFRNSSLKTMSYRPQIS